jgi:hypothetical protein
MAFNEDDIQIKVTLDTTAAVASVDNLKASLDVIFKQYRKTFNDLTKVTKDFAKLQTNLAKVESKEKVDLAKLEAGQRLANAKLTTDKLKALYKAETAAFTAEEKTKQARARRTAAARLVDAKKLSLQIVQTQQETVRLRNERQGSQPNPFTGVTAGLGKTTALVAGATAAFYAGQKAVRAYISTLSSLAKEGFRLEGLESGFNTLQRAVGAVPEQSLNNLRRATQGLVSDVEIYQKANQAVLLNIPTELFNDAAAAAVKLGRAMGIDAAFALESLSLGLGRQSRLYLDNLGIVVNTTQAYQNFAASVGKSADQLTDAEKRYAFFAETQSKLKEGLEGLPEVQDSVGVAFARLETAVTNSFSAFIRGFNENEKFAETLNNLATRVDFLTTKFEKFGSVVGSVFNFLGKEIVFPSIEGLGVIAGALGDAFGGLTIQEKANEVFALRRELANLEDTYSKLTDYQKRISKGTNLQAEIEDTKNQIKELTQEVVKFYEDRKNAPQVAIRVDTQDLTNQIAETEQFFSDFKTNIEQSLGTFKVAGADDAAVQSGLKALTDAYIQIEQKSVGAAEGARLVSQAIEQISEPARLANIALTIRKISDLDQTSSGYKRTLAQLSAELNKQVASRQLEQRQLQSIKRLEQEASNRAKKTVREARAAATERANILKKEEDALKSFLRQIRNNIEDAIPPQVVDQITGIFSAENLSTDELLEALTKIRAEFIAAGGDVAEFEKRVQEIQKSIKNAGAPKQEEGGGFFGFDLGEGFTESDEQQIAGSLQNALSTSLRLAFEGFSREDLPELAEAIGSVIGTAIGASFGGAAGGQAGAVIGGEIGKLVGQALQAFGDDKPGTKERKEIDKYFADLFDGDRLGTVIEGEVFLEIKKRSKSRWGKIIGGAVDVLTGGLTMGAGTALGESIDRELSSVGRQIQTTIEPTFQQISDIVFEGFTRFAGFVRFGSEEVSKGFNAFSSYFQTLPQDIQSVFTGVGVGFGELIGVSEEQSKLIGTALANNIGGSLQNLQVLVMQTGESLEALSEKVIKSFLDSKLSIEDAYNSLLQLNNIFTQGIPNAIGAYEEAIRNLFNVFETTDKPGLFAVDSLRDIGVEALEAGRSFEFTINELGKAFDLSAEQIQLLFVAFRTAGVNSLDELANASDELTISLLERIRRIREEIATTAEDVESIQVVPEIQAPEAPSSRGPSGPDPAEERRRALEALRQETYRLLIASRDYANILKQINSLELTNIQGGREIRQLREEIFKTLRRVNNLEEKYQKELDKGARASEKRLSRLGRALDEARKKLADLTETADESTDSTKQLDLSGIIPLIRDANKLSVVTQQAGVDLNKNIDILIKGFLQGRLSISEVNAEIEKTRELLGPGIPNAVGAVTDAFQNLIDAGEQGGAFSVDAFTDIFAEFREKFEKEGSALREAQRQQLVANLEQAKQAFAQAVGPEATAEARKSLDLAKKALSDFYDEIPAPDLEDLRSQLQSAFSPEQVDLFFRALDESGLKTFDDFEKAGADSVIGILGRLKELGFQFNETADDIIDINDGLQDAEKNANGGLDPLAEAIELVKQFNEGASTLPPVFNSTTEAIGNMQGPLQQLSDGFDNIIEKLSLLSGQTFENNVVFNVRTVGDSNSQTLIDILFGDGGSTGGDVGGEGPGVGSDTRKLEKFRKELQKLKSSGRGKSRRADILRRRIRLLTGGGNSL